MVAIFATLEITTAIYFLYRYFFFIGGEIAVSRRFETVCQELFHHEFLS
jgi:hypothetical protein